MKAKYPSRGWIRAAGSTFIAVCALSAPSAAQEAVKAKDIEDLQREVRALEARLRALSQAATEVAELTMRSAAIWSRALAGEARVVEEPAAKSKPKPSAVKAPQRPRPVTPALEELGTVRGKVNVPEGEPIAYAYVENVFAPPVRGKKVVIDQRNKSFIPSWAVVRRGTTIEFPNHDNIYHNVFSHSSGNAFDLGLYNAGTPAKAHAFQSAGAADIYCNIHPTMAASVLVVPNDLFAKIQQDGTFVIKNVPSGQRKIVAWSPGTNLSTKWVELQAGGTANVELTLEDKSGMHKNKEGRAYGSYQ
jgi:plastocyanin